MYVAALQTYSILIQINIWFQWFQSRINKFTENRSHSTSPRTITITIAIKKKKLKKATQFADSVTHPMINPYTDNSEFSESFSSFFFLFSSKQRSYWIVWCVMSVCVCVSLCVCHCVCVVFALGSVYKMSKCTWNRAFIYFRKNTNMWPTLFTCRSAADRTNDIPTDHKINWTVVTVFW